MIVYLKNKTAINTLKQYNQKIKNKMNKDTIL